MMKGGLTAYTEIRALAKEEYKRMEATKVIQPKFKVIVSERKDGFVDVELYFSAWYQYANNHTFYAKAHKSWSVTLVEECNKGVAMDIVAVTAKRQIEENTVNKNVEIQFIEFEEFYLI
jgi:hypothetical protein